MSKQFASCSLTVLLLASGCLAETGAGLMMQGPHGGVVLDQRLAALRPIDGLDGASLLGAPVAAGFPVHAAAISGNAAVFLNEDQPARIYWISDLAAGGPVRWIDSELSAISRVFLSASGDDALVYSSELGLLQRIGGLRAKAGLSPPIHLTVPGKVSAVASNAAANRLLVAAGSEDGIGTLWLVSLDNNAAAARHLGALTLPASLQFAQTGDEAAAVSLRSGELFRIASLQLNPEMSRLAGPEDGLENPLAVCAAANGRWAVVNQLGTNLVVADQTGLARIDLLWKADRCAWVSGQRFALNAAGEDPLQILDLTAGVAAAVTVTPVDRTGEAVSK